MTKPFITSRLLAAFTGTALLILGTGCNLGAEGDFGNLVFTPLDCNLGVCDIDRGVAVGGVLAMHLDPANQEISTAGLDLRTPDANRLAIQIIPDIGGEPTWELSGLDSGPARIEAFDVVSGDLVDSLTIPLLLSDAIEVAAVVGQAVGPSADETYDTIWVINADQRYQFNAIPNFEGERLMGEVAFDITLDSTLDAGLAPETELDRGRLVFTVGPGEYTAEFVDPVSGATTLVLFDAR